MDRDQFLKKMRKSFEEACIESEQAFSLEKNEIGAYIDPTTIFAFSFFSTGYQTRQWEVENS